MAEKKENPVTTLKKRLQEASDFPALSRAVALVSQSASRPDKSSVSELTEGILGDLSMTSKLLKMVNTFEYLSSHTNGPIDTISRAVMTAGFSKIRNMALSLLLFDSMADQKTAQGLKAETFKAFMAGIIARETSHSLGMKNTEEIFICSLFHSLGKLLATYLLPDETALINKLIDEVASDEKTAAISILGVTYEDIGVEIATQWNFPKDMIKSMRAIESPVVRTPRTAFEKNHAIICFSNELGRLITKKTPSVRKDFKALIARYEKCFNISSEALLKIVTNSISESEKYCHSYDEKTDIGRYVERTSAIMDSINSGETGGLSIPASESPEPGSMTPSREMPDDAEDIIKAGLANISNSLAEGRSFNEILNKILDVMYNSMGFSRVLFCIRNIVEPIIEGRYGLGPDIEEIKDRFSFNAGQQYTDVFNSSISKRADIIISDISDPRVRPHIPLWYTSLVDAQTFMIFPVIVNDKPIGIIYADKPYAGDIKVSPLMLSRLKALRDYLVTAISKTQQG